MGEGRTGLHRQFLRESNRNIRRKGKHISHVKSVDLIITDLNALIKACERIPGLKFKHNQKTHRWWGRWVNDYSRPDAAYIQSGIDPKTYGNCEHAIEVAGSNYDIGVYKNPKGAGYVLAYDDYSTGQNIGNLLGRGLEKLKQAYAVSKATLTAKAKGWSVIEKPLANGGIKLQMVGM